MLKRKDSSTFLGALLLSSAFTVPAFAQIEVVVVTAEKRSEDLQTVPVAISVFGSDKRDLVGINSIQDMTNFTPGLQYSTATDRISLRGVGRMTNVLSADASVANYDDGLYETFAVAAGRSGLDLDRVEVLRGPQGTLYGRNAIGGALNEITRRPTHEFEGEVRATYGNYDHLTLEGAISGPIVDDWAYRVYASWERQTQGWARNVIPGYPSEGNVVNQWYLEGQIQSSFFNGKLEMWTKVQSARWYNNSGAVGSASGGWNRFDAPTYEFGTAATSLNPSYGCTFAGPYGTVNTTVSSATSPLPAATACLNPSVDTPWLINRLIPYKVKLPDYVTLNTQWTWHEDNFDIKYVGGGTYYHYVLTGPGSGGASGSAAVAPISSYNITGGFGPPALTIAGPESFDYQEKNGFISNEINIISTGDSPLQWVVGAYHYQQHYGQPVFTTQPLQVQWNGPLGDPISNAFVFCTQTGGVCAPETDFRRFDNRPTVHNTSLAAFGQVDWKFTDTLKFTGGLRYSNDRKYGTESVRLLCFGPPACYAAPEFNPFLGPLGLPAVDLTQLGTVVSSGVGGLPQGVTGLTTYNAATGFASRNYNANWDAVTGTAGLEWQPDELTLVYGKYSRGYKSGGFNIGIFTVLSFQPYTKAEHVDSFEIGVKRTFGEWLTTNVAIFHYAYSNLQIPLLTVQTAGGLVQSQTAFYNVPGAISQGIELETMLSPIENLAILFNYSYLDAHSSSGTAEDPADPNATAPGATPLFTPAQCLALSGGSPPPCGVDIYTAAGGGNGWNIPQSLAGNRLPNSPRNKIAVNVAYTWNFDGGSITPSVSYVWRDVQYGTLFTRTYNAAPAWDQWDARLRYVSTDTKYEVILFGKNIFDTIGYDGGAFGTRLAGTIDSPFGAATNFVQGVNGPAGYGAVRGENATGQVSTFSPTPPATYGIEVHYKM